MLEERKIGKQKDLRESDKGQIVINLLIRSEHFQNCSSFGVFQVCSGQYPSKVVQGRDCGEPDTGSWTAKAN